ncbi:MAG TPA: hypothetical protein P5136_01465 [Methanofastidiosum sp.]|nr:hypothetical protein [Methanofastidiosum sp.]
MFNNYLKKIYKIDKQLACLKSKRKELMDIVEYNKIEQQGRYKLIVNIFKVRHINVEKYRELVTVQQFKDSIIIPVKTAEKYLSSTQIEQVVYRDDVYNMFIVKE